MFLHAAPLRDGAIRVPVASWLRVGMREKEDDGPLINPGAFVSNRAQPIVLFLTVNAGHLKISMDHVRAAKVEFAIAATGNTFVHELMLKLIPRHEVADHADVYARTVRERAFNQIQFDHISRF